MPARTGYVQHTSSPRAYPLSCAGTSTPYASTSVFPYPYHSSPTYSQSSSSGLMSPPPLDHSRSPYACAPLPALSCDIHPVLSANSRRKATLDVSYSLTHAIAASPVLSPRVLAEAATSARMPYFTISVDNLPWAIAVHPRSAKSGAYITVADVLHSIHDGLREQVLPGKELDSCSPQAILSAQQAFYSRCSRLASMDVAAADSEFRRGIRRIDFLQGTQFVGLLPTSEGPDTWKLILSS
ncbi:hypothetical protein R3P38DRAFT_2829534 [Favolaschia claudopus]|uniref:DUF6699 domain-containing protein n=1 Tax=Favolaschia claudopus TaxID=2862362 RepID=A0AAW0EAV8_9AGAR